MFTNWLTNASVPTSSLPPDVVLELGPLPMSRFAAHSTVLITHSGYFRSILRPDERILDSPIYVPNISTEHFGPLLTYMYTGYLDLNMENIFGVLLATHFLHMPRALEICRSFLARIPSEGYLYATNNFGSNQSRIQSSLEKPIDDLLTLNEASTKVIRPIASKAQKSSIGFVAPPMANALLPSRDTPFKSFISATTSGSTSNETETKSCEDANKIETHVSPLNVSSDSTERSKEIEMITDKTEMKISSGKSTLKRTIKAKTGKLSIVESAIALSAINSSDDSAEKVIIDIACCDGPVRFQRVLNSAYNRQQPKSDEIPSSSSTMIGGVGERNHSSVANSFHIQMARNISERHATMTLSNDSENSRNSREIVINEKSNESTSDKCTKSASTSSKAEEVYNCIYCKHTFKSQYCYQKHAKRHLNPLSIDGDCVTETVDSGSERDDKSLSNVSTVTGPTARTYKREVRPLDMNVQYYPCKTCGSKFPSYYFVHKHRKLCHANEEN